jgi:predicted outer membrane protein
MKYVGVYVVAGIAALLWAAAARAEVDGERTDAGAAVPALPAAQPAPARPAMFAAASAASVKRMSAEQREERRFLKDAAATSRFETDASRLALARSNDPGVRSFAAVLIKHNASAGPALQSMLHGRGLAPPMLANDQRKTLNRLAKLSGARFDREYMQGVGLKQRRSDLLSYERAGLAVNEPALKAWIAATLPALRDHLAMVERIASSGARSAGAPGTRAAAAQFMGASTQPRGTQPVSARPSESNSR